MQLIYGNHTFVRAPSIRTQSSKAFARKFVIRVAEVLVVALAVLGAQYLMALSPFGQSTAEVAPPVAQIPVEQAFEYFPSQYGNQARDIEEPVAQY